MDQAVGQMRGSDEKLPSSTSNIKIRDQESGNLFLEFILNYFDFTYFLGLFKLIGTFECNRSPVDESNRILEWTHRKCTWRWSN